MKDKSTHFIFDGEKIIISPDLYPIVNFLQEIEKEVETFLGFEKKLGLIRKQCLEILKLVEVLSVKLKENSIDFSLMLSENPSTLADKLKITRSIRSEMIVLFANLETLFCLNIAYENKTSDKKEIIKLAMNENSIKSFLKRFCLNKSNEWSKKNPERLKHITIDDLRKLRNSLTHFFSVDKGLGVSYAIFDAKSRKLERITNFKAKFISPEDLHEIIKSAAKLIIKKWNEDCRESLAKNSDEFKTRILCVKDIIEKHGAVIIKTNQLYI